jgi:hypothetical protein
MTGNHNEDVLFGLQLVFQPLVNLGFDNCEIWDVQEIQIDFVVVA